MGEDGPRRLDTGVPHIARVYDYWLGGKDNYAADRELAEQVAAAMPSIRAVARANRAFLGRVVHHLAAEAGIGQFLDIGTGLPSANNTHEVAQRARPASRVVYVDNDPIVLAHAQALLRSAPEGATGYIDADIRDTGRVLAEAAKTLDFTRPVAVMLIAVVHSIPDEDDPYGIVATLLDAVAPGSYLAVSHAPSDVSAFTEQVSESVTRMNQLMPTRIQPRSRAEVARFFDGLDLLDPGVVSAPHWRPGPGANPRPLPIWAAVGRKPDPAA